MPGFFVLLTEAYVSSVAEKYNDMNIVYAKKEGRQKFAC